MSKMYGRSLFFIGTGHSLFNPLKIVRDFNLIRPLLKCIRFKNLSLQQVSDLYKRTSFVININGDKQHQSIPMRIYEALASGSVVVNIVSVNHEPIMGFQNLINVDASQVCNLDGILKNYVVEDIAIKSFSSSARAKQIASIITNQEI